MFVPQYLSHHQINQLLWDECIDNAQNSMPYAYSWYLNTVAPDAWNALVLGDYLAVMPLPTRTKWSIVPYIYQPYWLQQLGIFSTFALSDNLINNFLKKIPVEFKYYVQPATKTHAATCAKHNKATYTSSSICRQVCWCKTTGNK